MVAKGWTLLELRRDAQSLDVVFRDLTRGDEKLDRGANWTAADEGDQDERQRTGTAEFQGIGDRARNARNDAGEDQQRDALADAALVDLLSEPDQEHGSAHQCDAGGELEEQAGNQHRPGA